MAHFAKYLTTPQAAEYLSLSKSWLEKLRITGGGPQYCRPSYKRVLYSKDALDAWILGTQRKSTSEELVKSEGVQ